MTPNFLGEKLVLRHGSLYEYIWYFEKYIDKDEWELEPFCVGLTLFINGSGRFCTCLLLRKPSLVHPSFLKTAQRYSTSGISTWKGRKKERKIWEC